MTSSSRRLLLAGIAVVAALSPACDAQAPAAPPSKPYLIVANQRSGVATLVEIASGRVSHVDLDLRPHEVALSPDGRLAALTIPSETMRTGHKVVLMDVASARVIRTMTLRDIREPHGVEFINDSVALVGALSGTSVAYVDVRNARVLRSVGGLPENPYVIKLTQTGRAYVSSPHSSKVSEIDVATGRVTRTIDIPDDPAGIAVSADGKELYGAVWRENGGGGIAIYDLERGALAAKLPATQPRRMTMTADGALLVVSDRGHLRIVERATRQLRSVDLAQNGGGSGVACAPDSTRCYVALSSAGEIVEVDVRAGRVLRRFAAERGVDGVAYVKR